MPDEIPEPYRPHAAGYDVESFHRLIEKLRHPEEGCPWDRSRSLSDMAKPLVDEAEEAAEALASDDHAHQCEELGDVFLNVMLATVIAEEAGLFTWGGRRPRCYGKADPPASACVRRRRRSESGGGAPVVQGGESQGKGVFAPVGAIPDPAATHSIVFQKGYPWLK